MTTAEGALRLPEITEDASRWESRFVRSTDPASRHFMFPLPEAWWSRPYEYHWAASFCEPNDVALDAASGVPHPLKFYLAERGNEVHAVDIDARIVDDGAILQDVTDVYGVDLDPLLLQRVGHRLASLTSLPYADGMFDKVYCISVLEHLRDLFNKWPWLLPVKPLLPFLPDTIEASLREFRRVLKDDGLIVLTFDYPRINLDYLRRLVDRLDLAFAGPVDFSDSGDVLTWSERGLKCVRVVLRKAGVTKGS